MEGATNNIRVIGSLAADSRIHVANDKCAYHKRKATAVAVFARNESTIFIAAMPQNDLREEELIVTLQVP